MKALFLLNMGGPSNLDEVETFLRNMFMDKHILNMPYIPRFFISRMIVKKRKEEAKSNYATLGGKSPIIDHSKKLVSKLQARLGEEVKVFYVMRYTPPFASDILEKHPEIKELFLFPLYPHYSDTTTASSFEHVYEAIKKSKRDIFVKKIDYYYADALYNEAAVERIGEALVGEEAQGYSLIFSAHGLPQKIVDQGDLYQKHIRLNLFFLRKKLLEKGLRFHKTHLAYQSKVGPMKWLEPSLEDKLSSLKNKKVLIYPIAFTIDNSETDFELSIEYREIAENMGFKSYKVARCLNESDTFVDALEEMYKRL